METMKEMEKQLEKVKREIELLKQINKRHRLWSDAIAKSDQTG